MKWHSLKTINPYFEEVLSGRKTFEMRKNDREFESGDYVNLMEYHPDTLSFTGRNAVFTIGYVLSGYSGIDPEYVIFSLIPQKTQNP